MCLPTVTLEHSFLLEAVEEHKMCFHLNSSSAFTIISRCILDKIAVATCLENNCRWIRITTSHVWLCACTCTNKYNARWREIKKERKWEKECKIGKERKWKKKEKKLTVVLSEEITVVTTIHGLPNPRLLSNDTKLNIGVESDFVKCLEGELSSFLQERRDENNRDGVVLTASGAERVRKNGCVVTGIRTLNSAWSYGLPSL